MFPISQEDFEAEFLKSEWYKPFYSGVREQFNSIVVNSDTSSQSENTKRRELLWAWRQPLLVRIPNKIDWYHVSIDYGEFSKFLVIREVNWEKTFGQKRSLRDVAEAIADGVNDRGAGIDMIKTIKDSIGSSHQFKEKIILISQSFVGPYTVLEGNHRAVAFQLRSLENNDTSCLPNEVILGVSLDMDKSPWLNWS